MWFVLSHYWIAAVVALGLGVLIGFITWGRLAERKGLNSWLVPMLVAVVIALVLMAFKVFPGRSGVWLESAMILFGLYIVGCFAGGWLKSIMYVPASTPIQTISAAPAKEVVVVRDVPSEVAPLVEMPKPVVEPPVTPAPEPKAIPQPKPKKEVKSEVKPEAQSEIKPELPELIAAIEGESDHAGQRPVGYKAPKNGLGDDLKIIKGIAKVNEARLHALGIWHFEQIAQWTNDEILWVGSYLAFPGRIQREKWVEQSQEIIAKAKNH